ncbi:MAG: hypothetical protein IJD68_00520 [Ruminococcus sp.]|nr:hypothetical protein [Ruminococcus sp.]
MEKSKRKTFIIIAIIFVVVLIAFLFILLKFSQNHDEKTKVTDSQKHISTVASTHVNSPSEFIEYIEEHINFEFPKDNVTYDLTSYTENKVPLPPYFGTPKYHCVIKLNKLSEKEIESIEKQLEEDERFIETLGDLKVLIRSVGGDNLDEYKMVYIMDTQEFNTMPDKAGKYNFIKVAYDADLRIFSVSRFSNNYWNLPKSAP